MLFHHFPRSVYHHLFQGHIFFVGFLGQTFVDALHDAALDSCSDVYLADAVVDAGLEVLHAGAAAAVQDEGQAVGLVNLDEAPDVQLRRVDIVPMQVTDGDGQRVDARSLYEAHRLLHIGEDIGRIHA